MSQSCETAKYVANKSEDCRCVHPNNYNNYYITITIIIYINANAKQKIKKLDDSEYQA